MRKSLLSILLSAALIIALFTGCGSGSGPTLPSFDLYSSSISGTVEYVDGQNCRIVVVEEDDHYSEDTTIQVTYASVDGKASVEVGDKISFRYNYIEDVTEYNSLPHITIERVHVG